jgi:23S rRNA (uracil1939-C5)-methyltransferase
MKLRIEKAIYGGAGLARVDGKAVFVPFALPGELVEAHVVEDRQGYAQAELDSVLEASVARAVPPCPYFESCGGCHYQHANYEEQVGIKVGILREMMERAHLDGVPEISAIHAEPLGYRNRIRLHVQREPFALCYKHRGSHAQIAVDACPIAAPFIADALEVFRLNGAAWGLQEWADEIEFFANGDATAMLVSLWTRRDVRVVAPKLAALLASAQRELPSLTGLGVFRSEQGKQQGQLIAQAGEKALIYTVAGQPYRASLGSFFQVNAFLIDRLVALVTGGHEGDTAWDLYAGVGLFARQLTAHFSQVVAVESSASSLGDLQKNLYGARHRAVAANTLDFLRRAQKQREPAPTLVVVDPPRAGLGKEVTTLLGEIRPRHITYVSCDPATLSRDLRALVESGYHLRTMHMVDLFPQTFHLESVTTLSLN